MSALNFINKRKEKIGEGDIQIIIDRLDQFSTNEHKKAILLQMIRLEIVKNMENKNEREGVLGDFDQDQVKIASVGIDDTVFFMPSHKHMSYDDIIDMKQKQIKYYEVVAKNIKRPDIFAKLVAAKLVLKELCEFIEQE